MGNLWQMRVMSSGVFVVLAITVACGGGSGGGGTDDDDDQANAGNATRTPNFEAGSDIETVKAVTIGPGDPGKEFEVEEELEFELAASERAFLNPISEPEVLGSYPWVVVNVEQGGFVAGYIRDMANDSLTALDDVRTHVALYESEQQAADAYVALRGFLGDACTQEPPEPGLVEDYAFCSADGKANGAVRNGRFLALVTVRGSPGAQLDSVGSEALRIQAERISQ